MRRLRPARSGTPMPHWLHDRASTGAFALEYALRLWAWNRSDDDFAGARPALAEDGALGRRKTLACRQRLGDHREREAPSTLARRAIKMSPAR